MVKMICLVLAGVGAAAGPVFAEGGLRCGPATFPMVPCVGAKLALSADGQAALDVLGAGLAPGASMEDSRFAGLKAEAALQGLKLESKEGSVQAAGQGLSLPEAGGLRVFSEDSPSGKAAAEPPPPSNPPTQEKKGVLSRAFSKMTTGIGDFYSKQCKAVRVAILLGLMVAEVGTLLYPMNAVALVAQATAALALFGTTRELINEFRRNRRKPPPPPPAPGGGS